MVKETCSFDKYKDMQYASVNDNILVSVIIPTYGRAVFLEDAIKSVISQTYPYIEVIIVDDNGRGTNEQLQTEKVVLKYKDNDSRIIYIVHDTNKNGSAARNSGISNSNGQYICFLDDDDSFLPDKIEKQITTIKSGKWVACICGHIKCYDNENKKKYSVSLHGDLREAVLTYSIDACSGSTLMVRADICKEINGFNESLKRSQDYNFLARLAGIGPIILIPDTLVHIRIHNASYKPKSFEVIENYHKDYIKSIEGILSELPLKKKIKILRINNYIMLKKALLFKKNKKVIFYFFRSGNLVTTCFSLIRDWKRKLINE